MTETPTRWIALLRGINVGGHRVTMERLRALFMELEVGSVETFIASGNVIFEAAESDPVVLEQKIEAHLKQVLGYEVATFLRTPTELATVWEACPFAPEGNETLYVTFHKAPQARKPSSALPRLSARQIASPFGGASSIASFREKSLSRMFPRHSWPVRSRDSSGQRAIETQ